MRFGRSVGIKLAALAAAVLFLVFIFTAQWVNTFMRSNVEQVMYHQARSLHQQVVLVRHWNASYGGVYVLKKPGVETNKYLYQVGPSEGEHSSISPEIRDSKGNVYTLKNPALMGRELSELTEKNSDIRFRLTSLKPINPSNFPDDFEKRSLMEFEAGKAEASEFAEIKGKQYYRYMAPTFVEESCLQCHGFQGYKVGDVRGGISISLPMESEVTIFLENRDRIIFFAGLLSILVGVTIVYGSYFIVMRPLRAMTRFAGNMGGHQPLSVGLTLREDEVGLLAKELTEANTELHFQRQQIQERTQQLEHESRSDALTGLYNRRYLFSEGARLYDRWQREGLEIAILMIDIDHFKSVNDKHGHQVGDVVLAEVAHRLRQQCRPYDLVARYGGEEFMVMLEASTHTSGESTANRILQTISENPVITEGKELSVTVSIGVVEGRNLGDLDSALRKADEALYKAKDAGRNCMVAYV